MIEVYILRSTKNTAWLFAAAPVFIEDLLFPVAWYQDMDLLVPTIHVSIGSLTYGKALKHAIDLNKEC